MLAMISKLVLSDDWIAAQGRWAKEDGQPSPVWSLWDPGFITAVSKLPQVREVMAMGSVLAVKVQDQAAGRFPPVFPPHGCS